MVSEKYNYCNVVGRTDVGCVRKANEDNLGSKETVNGLVAVVCDGMGGHVGGATASKIAVETVLEFLDNQYYENPQQAIGMAIDAANNAVLARTEIQPELRGMGSTCVLLIVRDGKVYIGSVGDSRVYLVRNHIAKQLTKDQSYVQMLVDLGQITEEQAEHHVRKNEITNAIGIAGMKPATVLPNAISPEAGDCFLLCSDGLSGMVPKHEIEKTIGRQAEMRAQERADILVEKAKQYGGLDNVTVQLVEFSVTPKSSDNNQVSNKRKKLVWICAAALLAICGICAALLMDFKKENEAVNYKDIVFNAAVKYSYDSELIRMSVNDMGVTTLVVGDENKSIPCKVSFDDGVEFDTKVFTMAMIDVNTLALKFKTDTVSYAEIIIRGDKDIYRLKINVSCDEKNVEDVSDEGNLPAPDNNISPSEGSQNPPKVTPKTPVPVKKEIKQPVMLSFDFPTQTEKVELMCLKFKKQIGGLVNLGIKYPNKDTFDNSIVQSYDINTFKCDSCQFDVNDDMIVLYHPINIVGKYSFSFSYEDDDMIYPYNVTLNYIKTESPKVENDTVNKQETPVDQSGAIDTISTKKNN